MTSLFSWRALFLFVVSIVVFSGVSFVYAPRPGEFKASVLEMGLGFTAKAMCSCMYVSEQSEDDCRAYANIEQVSPTFTVDGEHKSVTSSFVLWSAKADYLGTELGCVLE
jgi:hypothetical protein